jgi:hypothetical protein
MALTRARLSQVNTEVASLQDPITLINRDATTANVDVGFVFNRDAGTHSNVAVVWNESGNTFAIGYTASTGADNSNVNITSHANLTVGNIFGNIGGGTSTANVYITGALLPTANIAYDLGSSTRRFKTLWLASNTIDLGGESISVDQNGTWSFSSQGATVRMGKNNDFDAPTINSTSGTFTTFNSTGTTKLSTTSGNTVIVSTTQSSSITTGALVVTGGVGIAKSLYILNTGDVSANLGAFYNYANTKIGTNTNSNLVVLATTAATSATDAALVVQGGAGIVGNLLAGNVNGTTVSGTTASFTNVGGTLTTASQPNVTTLAGLTTIGAGGADTAVQGNLTVVGNLTVQGNTLTIGSNNLSVVDSIVDIHTFANLAPLISDDGRDIGLRLHYYKGADVHAFLGWENDTQTLIYLQNSTESSSNVTGTYGNVQFGSLLLSNTTAATSTTTGAFQVRGGAGINGELWLLNTGDVSANIGAYQTYANANVVAIQADLGAYQTYANANVVAIQANLGAYQTYANANVVAIQANLGAYQLYANADTGSFYNYANTKIGTNTNGNLVASSGTESVSKTTGAAVVVGGIGASGNVTAGKFYTDNGLFWSANGVSALATGGTTAGTNPPAVKKYGDLWYNTSNDVIYEYLNDGTSDYWIDISSQTIAANTSNVVNGDLTVSGNVDIASGRTVRVNNKQAVNGPAFRAYIDSGQAITSGSQQKVTFGSETFDTNSNFSSSRFTPTIEGYYQLNATVRIEGNSGTGEVMITIWKNGGEYARGTNEQGTEQGANWYSMQVSDLAYANGSTDYFEIYIQQTSGGNRNTTAGTNISYFSGAMVRGA